MRVYFHFPEHSFAHTRMTAIKEIDSINEQLAPLLIQMPEYAQIKYQQTRLGESEIPQLSIAVVMQLIVNK
jgi:hypothetical protein